MWMSSHEHTRPPNCLMTLFPSHPRETCCYAWHGTKSVSLTWDAPLSKAQGPGISVSRVEPSGMFLSRFSKSSSLSLGRCLLLGQRSRMNLFSYHIGSLFHQDYERRQRGREPFGHTEGLKCARAIFAFDSPFTARCGAGPVPGARSFPGRRAQGRGRLVVQHACRQ